jgi:hypothetical protein
MHNYSSYKDVLTAKFLSSDKFDYRRDMDCYKTLWIARIDFFSILIIAI